MSHLCDSTVAGPAMRTDNVLPSMSCKHAPCRYPPLLATSITHCKGNRNRNRKETDPDLIFCFVQKEL